MHQSFCRAAALVASALLFIPIAIAQETRATLSGTVTDSSGSVVAGAALVLANIETGVENRTETNSLGQYRFLFLNPGTYRLTVDMAGFRKSVREGIALSTGQAATLDLTMQIGSQTETVTVTSDAPLI